MGFVFRLGPLVELLIPFKCYSTEHRDGSRRQRVNSVVLHYGILPHYILFHE